MMSFVLHWHVDLMGRFRANSECSQRPRTGIHRLGAQIKQLDCHIVVVDVFFCPDPDLAVKVA